MTPTTVIAQVRQLVQDNRVPYRYTDTMLLGFVNQAIKRIMPFRPDLFTVIENIDTTTGSVLQSLPSSAVRLVEVFQVAGGGAVTEVNRETLDQMYPAWVSEDAGQPVNFMRHPRNPTKFFLYPRPAAGVQLVAEYVDTPGDLGMSAPITAVPESFFTAIIDCVVFLAESIDNEHVNSGRAKLFYDAFTEALGTSLSSRVLSDAEGAAVSSPKG